MSQVTQCKTTEQVCPVKQQQNLKRHQRQSHEHMQENQQSVQRHLSEVPNKVQVQQVPNGEDLDILRCVLFQSDAEGSHCQNLCTTGRSGVSENLSEIQHLRHERERLTAHSRNLETETQACQSAHMLRELLS